EHSVEDFNNLIVVYWIQNMQNGVVLQAGKTEAALQTGLPTFSQPGATAYIQGNALHIRSEAPVQSVSLYNIAGQEVLSATVAGNTLPVESLPRGISVVKVTTAQGESVEKVIKY
ncbi:MAG: T9SS type A sorting domain-containing protein, partial [Dysgonamonadaceae bacterium]|nr:T9SS type A sorting domain-containing protein [Dysgonamonadaceae bacterium]